MADPAGPRILRGCVHILTLVLFFTYLLYGLNRTTFANMIYAFGGLTFGALVASLPWMLFFSLPAIVVAAWNAWADPQDRYGRVFLWTFAGVALQAIILLVTWDASDSENMGILLLPFIVGIIVLATLAYFFLAVFLRRKGLEWAWYVLLGIIILVWIASLIAGAYARESCWGAADYGGHDRECYTQKAIRESDITQCDRIWSGKEYCVFTYANAQSSPCVENGTQTSKAGVTYRKECTSWTAYRDGRSVQVVAVGGYACRNDKLSHVQVECNGTCSDGVCTPKEPEKQVYAQANESPADPVKLRINGEVNPAPVRRGDPFVVEWNSSFQSCTGFANYILLQTPTAEGPLWTDQRNLPPQGRMVLIAQHKNFPDASVLDVGLQCSTSGGGRGSVERYVPIID